MIPCIITISSDGNFASSLDADIPAENGFSLNSFPALSAAAMRIAVSDIRNFAILLPSTSDTDLLSILPDCVMRDISFPVNKMLSAAVMFSGIPAKSSNSMTL